MFNNAGIVGASGPIDELLADEFDRAMPCFLGPSFWV